MNHEVEFASEKVKDDKLEKRNNKINPRIGQDGGRDRCWDNAAAGLTSFGSGIYRRPLCAVLTCQMWISGKIRFQQY